MEKKLKKLFDYQKFENAPELQRLIDETNSRCRQELDDSELETLYAAGDRGLLELALREKKPLASHDVTGGVTQFCFTCHAQKRFVWDPIQNRLECETCHNPKKQFL